MSRKIFISTLGTGDYNEFTYVSGDVKKNTRFAQVAALDIFGVESWDSEDAVYILLTKKARKSNWDKDPEGKTYSGLEYELSRKGLAPEIYPIDIPDNYDDEGIWNLFEIIYNLVQQGDEIYLDLTHAFRFLPMLLLVFCSYSKFLKSTRLCKVSYCNWESRIGNEAPVVDLMPIAALQDWAQGAGEYINSGSAKTLCSLSKTALKPILKETKGKNADAKSLRDFVKTLQAFSSERINCRGKQIIGSGTSENLKKYYEKLDTIIIKPLAPIVKKVLESISDNDITSAPDNLFYAAKWCEDNGLYQQAATILREYVVAFFCEKYKVQYDVKEMAELVASLLGIATDESKRNDESKWLVKNNGDKEFFREHINDEKLIDDDFRKLYVMITNLRNDLNHAGMNDNPRAEDTITKNIKTCISEAERILVKMNRFAVKTEKHGKLFVNLSNHKSALWDTRQLSAAQEYGEILDMDFPKVSPDSDENEIESLVDEYYSRIMALSESNEVTVHLMGEMTFTFSLISRLKSSGMTCIASTTRRETVEEVPGIRSSVFEFARFRRY